MLSGERPVRKHTSGSAVVVTVGGGHGIVFVVHSVFVRQRSRPASCFVKTADNRFGDIRCPVDVSAVTTRTCRHLDENVTEIVEWALPGNQQRGEESVRISPSLSRRWTEKLATALRTFSNRTVKVSPDGVYFSGWRWETNAVFVQPTLYC